MNKKALLKHIIIWAAIGIVSSLVAHFVLELYYNNTDFEYTFNLVFNGHKEFFILGSALLFIVYGLLSSLFGSSIIGSILLILVSWIIGVATQYKLELRSEPLFPNELYMVKELPFLLEMIDFNSSLIIIAVIIAAIILLVVLYKYLIKPYKQKHFNRKTEYVLRLIGVLVSILMLVYVSRFNFPGNRIKAQYDEYANWTTFNPTLNYDRNGFIAGFLFNLPAPAMEKPEGYSQEVIQDIVERYKAISSDSNKNRTNEDLDTNILFIMNETFSDPSNLDGIESNKDPLPNYRDIVQNTISGNVISPSIGGGTATNEFQVLTGFSMEPFAPHVTSPFIQLVTQMETLPSIVRKFNEFDYSTTAIHPYSPTMYRRTDVYNHLGVNEFLHMDTIRYRERISETHRYVSDFSAYQEVFHVLEETDEPDFVHLVTIQNHGPYEVKYDSVDYEVTGSGDASEANAYFKDLENSDIALRLLINKIDDFSEPVLLVFWGDHLPGFYGDNVRAKNDNRTMRETPFLVYSNRHDLDETIEAISPIYLEGFITDVLDIKVTPYESMLKVMRENLPIVENGYYLERGSSAATQDRSALSEEVQSVLNDYSMIMYDMSTGNQYAKELGFFEYFN